MNETIDSIKRYIQERLGIVEKSYRYEPVPEIVGIIKDGIEKKDFIEENRGILKREIPRLIDHTKLNPDATDKEIEVLCEEAQRFNFCSVCVNSSFVQFVRERLKGSGIKVSSTVGFPLGASNTESKVSEAVKAIEDGADELDMVINISRLKAGDYSYIFDEISRIVSLDDEIRVKVIIETCYLSEKEKIAASYSAKLAGAHYVKTSTGFGSYGAKVEDVKLIREVVGDSIGVKAAGGIRDIDTLLMMVAAGATRIGTSSGVKIIKTL